MLVGFDHVIIGVHNLAAATRVFEERLGLRASGGGVHPMGGTENRIIVIGETYLELIRVRTPEEAQQSTLERLAKGEGYLNCVFGSDDIQADSAAMRGRGVAVIGPNEGRLTSADGRSRGWLRSDVERANLAQHYPFIIQHDSSGEERRLRLAGWQTPPEHPLGAVRVLNTTLAVADLAEATARFQRIYDFGEPVTFAGEQEGWDDVELVAFTLGDGTQQFQLVAPRAAASRGASLPAAGGLAQHLKVFGESLYCMTLGVKDLAAARAYLDERGVRYSFSAKPGPVVWISPDEACGAAIALREV